MTNWVKRPVEREVGGNITYVSIPFTWNLPLVRAGISLLNTIGRKVVVGGPAVNLMPEYLADIAEIGTDWPDAVRHHNLDATFTSRGCIRRCSFCAVWRTEGKLKELDDWPVRPIICDNNLLACSTKHFDNVIDKLKPLPWCDFNQGLDARLLTKHHAERMTELKKPTIRLAFDHVKTEQQFLSAWELLTKAGLSKRSIRVYVLFGYKDTPEDALYRLQLVQSLGTRPNPMRYQPLDALAKNEYIDPNWTDRDLRRVHRYFSRLRWLEHIPFEEYEG